MAADDVIANCNFWKDQPVPRALNLCGVMF